MQVQQACVEQATGRQVVEGAGRIIGHPVPKVDDHARIVSNRCQQDDRIRQGIDQRLPRGADQRHGGGVVTPTLRPLPAGHVTPSTDPLITRVTLGSRG